MLSNLALECIRTRFSNSSEALQLNAEGFRRISNPLNWPIVSNEGVEPRTEPDITPPYLDIPDDLHSVQTLQFLGFQRANAKEIFEDYTSPENEKPGRSLGFAEHAKAFLDAAETVTEIFIEKEEQPMDDISKVLTLTQVFMGLNMDGDRLEMIDPPERPLYLSQVKGWVIEVLERRYEFLCKLDSAIVGMEMTYRRLEEDEAKRKARNRKKAEAKKAAKQKRKVLMAGGAGVGTGAGADEGRAEGGDGQGRLLGEVEFANDAEDKGRAKPSKDLEGDENLPKVSK